MTVREFDTDKGLYIFELNDFETAFHSHPATEIIIANSGTFTVCTNTGCHPQLKFAVIAANKKHKLSSADCHLTIVMIEHHHRMLYDYFASAGIYMEDGYCFRTNEDRAGAVVQEITHCIHEGSFAQEYDQRISAILHYLQENEVEYSFMMQALQSVTNLSESRLSHLFTSAIGLSLKKYLVWTKLKLTIKQHLNNKDDLFSSLLSNGFYDQPHFSRSFKTMLGLQPSKAYNSRIVQVFPDTR